MQEYYVIGMMSGTSLDGLDIAYCKFVYKKYWSSTIIFHKTIPYVKSFRDRLKRAPKLNKREINILSDDLGLFMAEELNKFTSFFCIDKIDFIASHGHTVFHKPNKRITLQVGSPNAIYDLFKCPVIFDFRTQDINLGGQGAPLVAIVDKILFYDYDACLNLGGFSNISFDNNKDRVAFDICPVNIVLNLLSNKIGYEFDDKGLISSQGYVDEKLFKTLNNLDFYTYSFPKSLAWEWVLINIIPLLSSSDLSIVNQMRTFVEHIAFQISSVAKLYKLKSVLISGGGTYNDFLISRLENYCPCIWIKAEKTLLEFKEAMSFAFMGLLRINGEINILSSVTGSVKDHSSGRIFPKNCKLQN